MKKILRSVFLVALTLAGIKNNAQVSVYAFNQLSGTYNPIIPGSPSSTIIAQGSQDDNSYASFPIGFNFFFNGSTYTTFGLNVNGWISLGSATPFSSYNPISSGSTNNIISAFARDLQLGPYQSCNVASGSNVITFTYPAAANFFNVGDTITGTGIPFNASVTAISAPNMTISSPATSAGTSIYTKGRITYALTGVSPNQVLTVQWSNCGRWSAGSTGLDDQMNFQIKLYETTNIVEVIYGTTGTNNAGTATMEVGLRGNSTADYNNRSVLSGGSWAASAAGSVNSASGFFSSTTSPSSGQIYRWSPPAGCTGTPASNSVVSNASVVCSSSTVNLSLATTYTNSGYAYQWFASPTGSAGSYTTIAGATSSTYAAVVNANSFYQAVITCTNGPASVTATPVQVNVGGNGCQCNTYCASNAASTNDEEIFNVTIGTLNNTSTCGQTGGPGSIMNEYSNYTGMLAAPSLTAGSTYPLSLTAGECNGFSYSAVIAAYIDYNQNGSFTDPGEAVYTSTYGAIAVTGTTFTSNITIPASAAIGITRMRVVLVESSVVNPCSGYTWGETEDYCINIQAAAACSGAPGANSAVASMTTVCPNGSVTISLANSYTVGGLTYQWSTATSSVGPYTSVPNATLSSYTASNLSANTWFQAVITCTNGMVSTTATPVQVLTSGNPCQCTAYCNSNATSTSDDEIFNVTLGSLNNTSTCGQTGGSGSLLNEYSNYAGIVAAPTVSTGTTYTMGVTVGQCNGFPYSGGVVVYMDFNQNGLFTDAGEMVYSSQMTTFSVTGTLLTFNISVPLTASVGITRMRVIAAESILGQASCGSFSWGETEDYCINIVPLPPCNSASGGTITTTALSGCANQTLALTSNSVSTGTGIAYQWMVSSTPGGSYTAVTGGAGNTTPSYTTAALSPTVYYYVLQTTCTTASLTGISNEATVTINANPTLAVTPSSVSICFPGGTSTPLSASGASTYSWIPAAGLTATTGANVNALPGATTIYTVTGTSAAGCNASSTTTVYISEGPSILSVTANPTVICSSGSSSLNAQGGLTSSYTITNIPYAAVPVPSTGVVTLCNNGSATIPLTQGSLDDGQWANQAIPFNFNFFGSGYSSFAVSTNGFIWLGAGNPNTYFGYGTPLPSTSSARPLIATVYSDLDFDGVGSGSSIQYFITGTSPNQKLIVNWTGQFYNNTGTVTTQAILYETSNIIEVHTFTSTGVNPAAEGIQDAAGVTAYIVTGRNAVTWPVTTPDAYRWSPNGGPVSYSWTPSTFLSSTSIANPVANNVTAATLYSVVITSPNGCSNTGTINLNVGTAPVITAVASPTSLCGSTGSVNITASGASSYSWSTGANTSSISVTPTASTVYSVVGTNSAGCVASSTVSVLVGNSPSVTITAGTGTVCAGGSTGLTANGASSYTWSTGSSAPAIAVTPSTTTTYSVTGDNGGGCIGTGTISIFVNSLPTVNISAAQTTVCVNGPTVGLTGSPAGGVYTGSNVAGNVFTPGANAGTFTPGYNVTSTVTGCSNTAYTTIIVSTCTGIDKLISSTNEAMIYPNPNTGIFTVELKNSAATLIELSDLTGRIILSEKTSLDKLNINISELANGIYLVKVQSERGTQMIKVIKE